MLVVAVKLYQQCSVEWDGEEQLQEEEEERIIIEQERQEDSNETAAELSPAGNNSNHHNNKSNRLQVLPSHRRQRNGPSSRATAGKERERETTVKVKKWT